MRIGIIISLLIFLLFISSASASTQWLNITSSKDVYVQSSPQPDTNYNGNAYVFVGCGSGCTVLYNGLIYFNIAPILNHTINNGTMQLYFNSDGTFSIISVYELNQTWVENTVTWNTRPTNRSDIVNSTKTVATGGYEYFNITNSIKSFANGSVINYGYLLNNNTVSKNFLSREGDNVPYLNISFENTAPFVPSITNLINNSRQWNNSVNFTFNGSDTENDTLTYDFFLSSQPDFSNTVNRTNFTNNWTGNIATTDGVTYFSKVRSYDGHEYSNWSNVIQFTENTKLVYTNITLSPSTPTSLNNLTVSFNVTDSESDTPTNYTRWYKDNILQTTLNNSLTVLASGNTSNGQKWRVDVFGYDGYENSTSLSSNEVIIGSSNAPPTFTSLSISPSTGQIGTVITINASGITDDSQVWRAQTYYLIGDGSKVYLGNSSWSNESYITYTVSSPWSDSETRVIYTNIYDSGNLTGYENLTSSPLSQYFVSQLTTVSTSTGGGGGVIIITPTPTPIVTEYKPSIDITSIGESSLGIILLEILLLGGFIVLISGLLEEGKMSSLIVGFIITGMSIYGLGWLS